jgi:RecA-family ATPase
MNALPTQLAYRLALAPEEERWLVEGFWSERAVGIVGGEPKCCKSFLALDLAVSVASGKPFLRRFPVHRPGCVLLFAAEDSLCVVRARLEGIAHAAGVDFAALEVFVITASSLRLDLEADRERLRNTVDSLHPRLLVLDPFVRLHRVDENVAADVAPLLECLRGLERRFGVAVALVHHARKGAAGARGGQALRGSSELHAWGDSNLYLRRKDRGLFLNVEHRAAASAESELALELRQEGAALALQVVDKALEPVRQAPSPTERLLEALEDAPGPMSLRELRAACRTRTATVSEILGDLAQRGEVLRTPAGYELPSG